MGQDTIKVHEKILCATSEFFKKATKSEWAESRPDPDTMDLTDDHPAVVKAYANWLYFRTLPTPDEHSLANGTFKADCEDEDMTKIDDNHDLMDETQIFLARAYVFGEKVIDNQFKDTIIDCMIACTVKFGDCPSHTAMNILYQGTLANSPARRLIVDFWVYCAHDSKGWAGSVKLHTPELIADALEAIVRKRPFPKNRPWEESPEQYHEKNQVEDIAALSTSS